MRAEDLLNELVALGLELRIDTLQVGDYTYGVVGVERKSTDFLDFNKMRQQISELNTNFDKAYLVVDCNLDKLITESKKYYHKDMTKSILGMVASLAVRFNTPPIFCSNKKYAAYIIKSLLEKGNDGKAVENIKGIRPAQKKEDKQVHILSSFPNISDTLAKRLLNHFDSLIEIFKATPEELSEVEGIGKIKAKEIYEVIRCQEK